MLELQVTGDILDEQAPAQPFLGFADAGQRHAARLLGIRQRQQVMEMGGAGGSPAQMLGHEHRGEACDGALELVDMVRVQRIAATQGEPTPCRLRA